MSFNGCVVGAYAYLPVEILENIFCQVPFQDLMRNCTAVCHGWNDVIKRPEFLIWKKDYHRLIMGCQKTLHKVQEIMDKEGLRESPESFTPLLCNYVKDFRSKNPTLLNCLQSHSKYPLIKSFLSSASKSIRKVETLQNNVSITNTQQFKLSLFVKQLLYLQSPWSVIMLLTIVSTTVQDITEIIWTMMSKTSNCLVIEVMELFYLLATMFWMMKSEARINSGLHYRIIYACHLFESSSIQEPSFPGTLNDVPALTHEQLAIIKHNLSPEEVIKIQAFAGTGKTTTLVAFAKERPAMKFLNVSYNKSIQVQAEKIFPPNVKSTTIHSLAFRAVGAQYKSANKFGSAIRSTDVQKVLADDTTFIHAERVVQTVKNFLASSRRYMIKDDVTRSRFTSDDKEKEKYFNSDGYKLKVLQDARIIWGKMSDINDKDIYMTHDGYLKIYQLNAPFLDYDCILVDEAQDITPAVADILLSQRCSKILVGDPHQQIYTFRGAENAMESVSSSHTFYLTQSFRFGPEIAYVANSLLEVQKDYHSKTLIGSGKPGGIMGDTVGQLAIICRSNFGVFAEASRLCHHGNNLKVAFAGGIQGYNLDRLMDIYNLFIGKSYIKDPLIRRFGSYKELCKFVSDANDKELGAKIKIVEHFGNNVPIYINSIKNNVIEEASNADYIVSTAHKSKGLQFSTVRVNDDFNLVNDSSMISTKVTESDLRDENNLLYVAVTRAQNRLILNKTIMRALEMNKEHLLQPITGESYDGKGPVTCKFCYIPLVFEPMPSVIVECPKRTVYYKDIRQEEDQGFVCRVCTLEKVPHLDCFLNPTEKKKTKKKKKKSRRSSV